MSLIKSLNGNETIFALINQSVRILLGIMIFIKPFGLITTIEEICIYLALFLVAIGSIFAKKIIYTFHSPLTLPFLFFVFWTLVTTFFAINKENSLNDFFFHLLKYLAIYYLLINLFNSRKLFLHLSWLIIISAALFSFAGIIYFYFILGNTFSTLFRFHTYSYGYIHFLFVFAFLLSVQLLSGDVKIYQRLILFISLANLAIVTLLSQTRSALVAIILGLFILLFKNKKIFYFLIFSVIVFSLFLFYRSDRLSPNSIRQHANMRTGIVYLFVEMIRDYPLTGIGFGMQTSFEAKLLAKYNNKVPLQYRQEPPVPSPHNLLIDITVRLGFVGLGLFFLIIFAFIRMGGTLIHYGKDFFIRSWSLCLLSTFAAFLINGMAMDATFGIQAIVFYAVLAMMTILWHLNKQSENLKYAGAKREI